MKNSWMLIRLLTFSVLLSSCETSNNEQPDERLESNNENSETNNTNNNNTNNNNKTSSKSAQAEVTTSSAKLSNKLSDASKVSKKDKNKVIYLVPNKFPIKDGKLPKAETPKEEPLKQDVKDPETEN
jgi:hypothetical protein